MLAENDAEIVTSEEAVPFLGGVTVIGSNKAEIPAGRFVTLIDTGELKLFLEVTTMETLVEDPWLTVAD